MNGSGVPKHVQVREYVRGLVRDAVQLLRDAGDPPAARAAAEAAAPALVRHLRQREIDSIATLLGAAVDGSFALQVALGDTAWQRNDAKAAVGHYERAYALVGDGGASANGLLVTASALAAILEGWQDFDGTGRWMERLKAHLAARPQITDADAFEHVLETLDCRGADILFLDDNLLNVEAARRVGLESFVVQGPDDAQRVLQQFGIVPASAG